VSNNKALKAIAENPFRVLGLPVDATDRQITKRVNELSTLYEFGKAKDFDTDFPFISKIHRSTAAIEKAARQIELPEQKLSHANFWFWGGDSVDDLVYEVLKDGGVAKAITLWNKRIEVSGLSKKTYSNYKNLALLNLVLSLKDVEPNYSSLENAIEQFMNFFSNANYATFCAAVSGKTHNVEAIGSQKLFVDELVRHFDFSGEKIDSRAVSDFISSFGGASEEIQSYVKNGFIKAPVHRIEQLLDSAAENSEKDSENTYESARTLYYSANEDLIFLRDVLSDKDLHYQSIADQIGTELLNSSTRYFNANNEGDSARAVLDKSKRLTLLAQKVVVGEAMKKKVLDDLSQIDDLERGHQVSALIEPFMDILKKLLSPDSMSPQDVRGLPETINSALTQCEPILAKMKDIVGDTHESFVFSSNFLAQVCLGSSVKYANETSNYSSIIPVLNRVKLLKMESDTRSRLNENITIIGSNQIISSKKSSAGCYIATMVYGSYDAPEVRVLRRFRDEVLSRSSAGRIFIRWYYKVSPFLVRKLRNYDVIQLIIRRLLSKLVEVIK